MDTFTFSTVREIAATPQALFAAWADPARLARWWGPQGFSNRFECCEFEVGGRWVFEMVGPDGAVYPNRSTFRLIEAPHRVVVQHLSAPAFQLSVTLTATPTGTRVRWEQVFAEAAVARAVQHIVEPANEQNLDRWAAEVQAPPPPAR